MQDGQVFPSSTLRSSSEQLLAALSADASMNDARVSLNTQLDSLPNETGERQRQFRRIHSPAELARRIPLARIGFRHAPDTGDDDLYAVAKRLF